MPTPFYLRCGARMTEGTRGVDGRPSWDPHKECEATFGGVKVLHRYEGVDMNDSQDFSFGAPRSSNLEPGLLVAGCWLAGFD